VAGTPSVRRAGEDRQHSWGSGEGIDQSKDRRGRIAEEWVVDSTSAAVAMDVVVVVAAAAAVAVARS